VRTPAERIDELKSWLDGSTDVYIDYANVRAKCEKKGWLLDFGKLQSLFKRLGNINCCTIYFGKIAGNRGSEGFHAMMQKLGFKVVAKPVKFMRLSIDVSGIPKNSPAVIKNFVEPCLLRKLKVEAVEYLNDQLRQLNDSGIKQIEMMKCNFDVEIARDMLLDHEIRDVDTFCLWSGDSDFAPPLLHLLNAKKRVVVISDGISPELNDLKPDGLRFYDIKKLRDIIGYEKQRGLSKRAPQQG
jgi:uncharacterized LabA/DUF88 family protein